MASISGQSTSNIDGIGGFYTTQGGGTASTTPTITSLPSSTYGNISLVVGNYAGYTEVNFSLTVFVGSTQILAASGATYSGATITWSDSSSLTGTRTVKLRAQEFGDYIQSAEATDTYSKVAVDFRYYRMRAVTSTGADTDLHMGLKDWRYFDDVGMTGTRKPSYMTSDILPTPYVASGDTFNATSYAPFKAFDSNTGTFSWTLSTPAADNWIQIDMGSSPPTLKSGQVKFYSGSALDFITVTASNTGSFSGEEITLNDTMTIVKSGEPYNILL